MNDKRPRAPGVHIPLIPTASDARSPIARSGEECSDDLPSAMTDSIELAVMIVHVAVGPGSWKIVVAPELGDRYTVRVVVDLASPDS
jgi:hypothetical protein